MQDFPARRKQIEFSIEAGDITEFHADVVALKHAQGFYGVDWQVVQLLNSVVQPEDLYLRIGEYQYLETHGFISAPHVLFLGVPPLLAFGYAQIADFARKVLEVLAAEAPKTRHLAMTIHGVGYGLDETEALFSQLAGCMQALISGAVPPCLERISIVERNLRRVDRLRAALEAKLGVTEGLSRGTSRAAFRVSVHGERSIQPEQVEELSVTPDADAAPEDRRHIFVAMSFKPEFEDLFYYGIQHAVHANGFICERIDLASFTGDIVEQLKNRIETAAAVIAELSDATPNVYLEVGYAWGKGRPTILLVKDPTRLHFDVKSHRCVLYESIRSLEQRLTQELKQLKDARLI